MSRAKKTPHLSPLPENGERRIASEDVSVSRNAANARAATIRLSIFQRERIEVRHCFRRASPERARLRVTRRPVPSESDDSKIATLLFRVRRESYLASDHTFGFFRSCDHRHPVRRPALQTGNRNRARKDRLDAVAGICNPQSSGSEDAAKGRVPIWWGAYVNTERGSRDEFKSTGVCTERQSSSHLNPFADTGEMRARRRVCQQRSEVDLATRYAWQERFRTATLTGIRLSLSQRERIEVRD